MHTILAEATSWPDVAMCAIVGIVMICMLITFCDAWPWQR